MRRLKGKPEENKLPPLPNVPDEFKFVEATARMHATSFDELQKFYTAGLTAALNYREKWKGDPNNHYERFAAWVVRQTILGLRKTNGKNSIPGHS